MRHEELSTPIRFGKQKTSKATFLSTTALIKAAVMSAAIGFSAIGTAHAQTRTIQNPSFEDGPTPSSFLIHSDTLHPGWESTNGTMETWADGFLGRDAQDGDYLIELNPSSPIGLYQEICLISGENLSWNLQHAARGTSGNQTIVYEALSLDGATTHQQLFTNTVTGMGSAGNNNTLNVWDNVTGSTTYNGPTGVQRLQFRSTNNGTTGNFLDNIQVNLVPLINFDGTNTSDYENVNINLPVLKVKGVVTSPLTISVDATPASTATEGVDYDFVTKTITIPAGTYDGTSTGSLFQIPLTIFEDGDHTEADETIIIEVVSALAADPVFNPVIANDDCTVTPQSASITHTILNTLLVESAAESFPPIDGVAGGVTTSVLASDELNGVAVDPADVTLTVGASDPELSLDPATGLITVAPGTAGGTYTVEYTICEIANPTNCSTVIETVIVVEEVPAPSLSMTKIADNTGPHAPGDVVTYTYTATNDGNVNINDVTVSDVHNGSAPLGPLAIGTLTNTSGLSSDDGADAVFDVLSPGDVINFTAEYVVTATDLIAGGPVTNTATATGTPSEGTLTPPTASESISLSGTPRPALTPGVCGSFTREGFIITPGSTATEVNADFGSGAAGPAPFDPYVLEPLFGRDASTGVVNFYQASADASATGSFLPNGVALANSNNLASTTASVANPTSEIWRVAARVDGVPGTTETLTIQNTNAHEHSAYWQTDVNGAIINTNSSSHPGQDDGWIFGTTTATGGDGPSYTIDVTYPADGIVILQFALLDSTGAFGGVNFDDYECPAPSFSMTKVADSEGPHAPGDIVTYTYTVTNDGNHNINDVAITDTHNGSDPAPIPGNETLLTDAAPTGDSTDAAVDGSWDVLAPGDILTFTGTYTITVTDADNL